MDVTNCGCDTVEMVTNERDMLYANDFSFIFSNCVVTCDALVLLYVASQEIRIVFVHMLWGLAIAWPYGVYCMTWKRKG